MLVQVRLEREGLVAALALVVLEGRVRLHVSAQIGAVCKGLPAVRAPERLLARVRAHVALQQPGAAERLAAYVAFVLEVVREQVHGHGRHGHVHLAARRALLGHLAVHAAVRLLVAAQVGRRGVALAALVARVALRGPRATHSPSARAAVRDEEGVHCVALTNRIISVDVPARDLRARAVGLVRVRRAVIAVQALVDGSRRGHFDAIFILCFIHRRGYVVADVTCRWEGKKRKSNSLSSADSTREEAMSQVLQYILTCNSLFLLVSLFLSAFFFFFFCSFTLH